MIHSFRAYVENRYSHNFLNGTFLFTEVSNDPDLQLQAYQQPHLTSQSCYFIICDSLKSNCFVTFNQTWTLLARPIP